MDGGWRVTEGVTAGGTAGVPGAPGGRSPNKTERETKERRAQCPKPPLTRRRRTPVPPPSCSGAQRWYVQRAHGRFACALGLSRAFLPLDSLAAVPASGVGAAGGGMGGLHHKAQLS